MAQNIVIGGATYPNVPGLSVPRSSGGNAYFMDPTEVFYDNAEAHNSISRGKNLGTSVTAAQWNTIDSATFEDLYPGDYWVINDYVFLVGGCDYWLGAGDTECTTHHLIIVPAGNLIAPNGSKKLLNGSDTTTGAYVGTNFYKGTGGNTAKADCLDIIESAFGSAHILLHRDYLKNAVTNGYESAGSWYDSKIELPNEEMVYGHKVFGNATNGTTLPHSHSMNINQLPAFAHNPSLISNRVSYWMRDVASSSAFSRVANNGMSGARGASDANIGIRPVFAICAEQEA